MRHHLKRTISFILLGTLLIGLCATALAAEPKNLSLFLNTFNYNDPDYEKQKQVQSAAAVGDTLYILTQNSMEKWAPETEPETVQEIIQTYRFYGEDAPDGEKPTVYTHMFADESAAYALDFTTGTVTRLTDDTGAYKPAELCKLDVSAFKAQSGDAGGDEEESLDYPQVYDIDVVKGTLYMVAVNYSRGTYSPEVFRWELATGAALPTISGSLVQSLATYKDGKMLCVLFDDENSWDPDTQKVTPSKLGIFDPETGKAEPLFELTTNYNYGLCYCPDNDTAYYTSGSTLIGLPGVNLPSKISAYFPNTPWAGGYTYGLLGGTMYFEAGYDGVIIRGLDMPEVEAGALTIYGNYNSRAHNAFLAAHPEIPVTLSSDWYEDLEGFTAAMVSGETTVDVLGLNSNYAPLQRLIDKGYAMDLSGNEKLVQLVDSMYPAIAEACKKDGKLYALPVSLDGWTITLENEAWEELGFTEEDIPTTFLELLDFVDTWGEEYAEDNPDYKLFDDGDVQYYLLRYLMENYVAYEKQQGADLDFDTELFRKLMQKFDSIDFSNFTDGVSRDDEEFWNLKTIFRTYMPAFYYYYYNSQDITSLPLALDEGLEPVIATDLTVLIINPRTTRPEQAMAYLENFASFYDPESANVSMFPDHNEAVPNLSYEKDLATWTKDLEDTKKRLETAEPENRAGIQSEVDYLTELVADSEKRRYLVSEEQIAYYRENIAPYMCVVGQTPLTTWDKSGKNDLYDLMDQYRQKAMTADQFVKEASKRVRMMALEDK